VFLRPIFFGPLHDLHGEGRHWWPHMLGADEHNRLFYDCDKVLLHSAHEVRDGSGVHRRMGMDDLERGRENGSVGLGVKVPRDYSLAVLRMLHTVTCIPDEL